MRYSAALAAMVCAPVLVLTACTTDEPSPRIRGIVVDKDYQAATFTTTKVPVTRQSCTTRKGKRTCTTVDTGRTKKITVPGRRECYELDIRLANGDETEVCDEAAYNALDVRDPYDSAKDYSEAAR